MNMEKLVVSLGGSLLFDSHGKFDPITAKSLAKLFIGAHNDGTQLLIITGGGRRAREYADKARSSGKSEFFADREAIKATRENAKELIKLLGKAANPKVMLSFDDASKVLASHKIGVGGGMLEGMTTDAISVLFAEMIGAEAVVNLGDTDGIFTADPKKDAGAGRIPEMTHAELVDLSIKNDPRKAGTHFVFDSIASKLAARSSIELRFVNGKKTYDVAKALAGRGFEGTVVKD